MCDPPSPLSKGQESFTPYGYCELTFGGLKNCWQSPPVSNAEICVIKPAVAGANVGDELGMVTPLYNVLSSVDISLYGIAGEAWGVGVISVT